MKIEIPHSAQRVIDVLEAAGYEAYVVGGCVRDALLGRVPNDWDITTSALPQQTREVAHAAGFATFDTGIKHGTITVVVEHDHFEVTTYRDDGTYSDGRHPDQVTFLDAVSGDLARRDFTVNAMAYNARIGLVDEFGGQQDLAAKVLRAVGSPHKRFEEDALRIMRGMRFSAQLGFSIEDETAAAIHECRRLLDRVSAERITAEFDKLICAPGCVDALLGYPDVLEVFLPEIADSVGFDQRNVHHCYTVWEHCARACAFAPADDLTLRYTALFHDIGKPSCYFMGEDGQGHFYGHRDVSADLFHEIAKRLKFPRKLADNIELLVRYHDANLPTTAKGMRHWAVKFSPEVVRQIFAIHRCDVQALAPAEVEPALANIDDAEEFFEQAIADVPVFGVKSLAVRGGDLMEVGCPQGPLIGKVLQELLRAVVDGEVANERGPLLEAAAKMISEQV